MNIKHFISFVLLFIIVISLLSGIATASDQKGRSYSIPSASIDLFVEENGNLHVKEKIHYSFIGTYNGVYRDIPIKSGEKLANLKVYAEGAYCSYNVTNRMDEKSIKIFLYSDPQKSAPINDRDVDVFIEYDFVNVIKIYNDVAELQYKLWGEGWEQDVGQLTANIHLKSNNGVQYWLNPPYLVQNTTWHNQTLSITTKPIYSANWFELLMAIPSNQFLNSTPYALRFKSDIRGYLEITQKNYENELNFKTKVYSLLTILIILCALFPLFIYFKFGREPKIDYLNEYERDLPSNDPPAVINALYGSELVGDPDINGFRATIMDLIDRDYLRFNEDPSNDENSLAIKITYKDPSKLKNFERDVFEFFKKFEEDRIVNLNKLKDELKKKENAKIFMHFYLNWKYHLKEELLDDETVKKVFHKKGNRYLKIYGLIGLEAAFFLVFLMGDNIPAAIYAKYAAIILGIVAIISLITSAKIPGQWTDYGRLNYEKWKKFKRYLKEFSMIKKHTPESIEVWNKYLVYATAFGIAAEVIMDMEEIFPLDQLARSAMYNFHYWGGFNAIYIGTNSGMSVGYANVGGGAGGGSGGGGGGAF